VQLADSFPIGRTFYGAENPGCLLQQLLLPTGNLVYVNVILDLTRFGGQFLTSLSIL